MEIPARIDRFVVEGLLGKGGMGEVYLAYDPKLRRRVAIKVLSRRSDPSDELTIPQTLNLRDAAIETDSRLLKEAQSMAQLSHPHVVPVYEIGTMHDGLFLVAEYIEGTDLFHWLKTKPPASARIELLRQAGLGLLAAHERGIIHRDFKPGNVLVGADGRARVADFGLAIQGSPRQLVRVAQRRAGTPGYMAPEVERGLSATVASDVYSYCATFLRALTGGAVQGSIAEMTAALRTQSLKADVAKTIALGCSADPRDRPSLAELMARLEPSQRSSWRWPVMVGVGAIAVGGLMMVLSQSSLSKSGADPCQPWPEITEAWTESDQDSMTSAFAATELGDSKKVATKASQLIANYRAALQSEHEATCERPDPDGAIRGCLERKLAKLEASVDVLKTNPEKALVKASADFLWELPDPKTCLGATDPPASEDQLGHEKRLIQVRGAIRSGKSKDEVGAMLETLEADVAEGPASMRGEVEYTKGILLIAKKEPLAETLKHFERANELALEAGDDALAVRCLTRLGGITGLDPKRSEEGLKFAKMANAQAVRANVGPLGRAIVLEALAGLTEKVGDLEAAAGYFEEALAVIEKSSYLNVYVRGRIRRAFSTLLGEIGRDDEELEFLELAVADYTEGLGENNPRRAVIVAQLGSKLVLDADHERGRQLLREAKEALEASEGKNHGQTMKVRAALAAQLFASGIYDEAYREFSALAEAFPKPENRIRITSMAAGALLVMTRYDEARAVLRSNLKSLEKLLGKGKLEFLPHYQWIAEAEVGLGNFKAASRMLKQAEAVAKKVPDNKRAHASLASLRGSLTERRDGCEKALTHYEGAVEISPSNSGYRNLGRCLVMVGQYKRGAENLEKALGMIEGYGDARRMEVARVERALGYARRQLGDVSGAELFHRSEAVLRERENWFGHVLDDGLVVDDEDDAAQP